MVLFEIYYYKSDKTNFLKEKLRLKIHTTHNNE